MSQITTTVPSAEDWANALRQKLNEFRPGTPSDPIHQSPRLSRSKSARAASERTTQILHDALSCAIHEGNYLAASRMDARIKQNESREVENELQETINERNKTVEATGECKQSMINTLEQEIEKLMSELHDRERQELSSVDLKKRTKQRNHVPIHVVQGLPSRWSAERTISDLREAEQRYVQLHEFHMADGARKARLKLQAQLDRDIERHERFSRIRHSNLVSQEAGAEEKKVRARFSAMRHNVDVFRAKREREIAANVTMKIASEVKHYHNAIANLRSAKSRLDLRALAC